MNPDINPLDFIECHICGRQVEDPYMCQYCQRSCHQECLMKYIRDNPQCPLCNKVVTQNEIIRNRIVKEAKVIIEPIKEKPQITPKPIKQRQPNKPKETNVLHPSTLIHPPSNYPVIVPPPTGLPSLCDPHYKELEYFFPCHNQVGCILCSKSHSQCPNYKEIRIKELQSQSKEILRSLVSNINLQTNNNTAIQNKHEERYKNVLIPPCNELTLVSTFTKNALLQKAQELNERLGGIYERLIKSAKTEANRSFNIFEEKTLSSIKQQMKTINEIDSQRLFSFQTEVNKSFYLNMFQPSFEMAEIVLRFPSSNKQKEFGENFKLYKINWNVGIQIKKKFFNIVFNRIQKPELISEICFLWSVRIYNHRIDLDVEKEIEYLTSYDNPFSFPLFNHNAEYNNELVMLELKLKPKDYLSYAKAFNIHLESPAINVPTRASKGANLKTSVVLEKEKDIDITINYK